MSAITTTTPIQDNAQATADVQIRHEGSAIVLPALPRPMDAAEAVTHLKRLADFGEKVVAVNEIIKAFPFDGAVAFMKAMQKKFGWATPEPTRGFFGEMRPPSTISVDISAHTSITIFWGEFSLPGIEGKLNCGVWQSDDLELFFKIGGEVRQKCLAQVQELAQLTREFVSKESIYRGKALYARVDDDGGMRHDVPPGFLSIDRRDPLILPKIVQASIDANLFTPVMKSEECRRAGIPLKRGVILAGPPGTGKTLTAQELAAKCVSQGWTYILVPKCRSLSRVIQFASRYAPAVVFAEDIDFATSGERDEALNELLNTVDGVNTKGKEIMLVFTTNNLANIDRTMVRPGRIDAIVEFPPPDVATIERFLRHYGQGMISPNTDLQASCAALEGAIPAIVREAVERAKLYAISRGDFADSIILTDDDISAAVETMRAHVQFFQSKKEKIVSPAEKLGLALAEVMTGVIEEPAARIEEIHDATV